MNSPDVIVAIPAFNEEERIGEVVRGCRAYTSRVWVVDDGSRDATADRAREAGARVIRHEQNAGKGMAIRTALEEFVRADGDWLVFLDADGQHDPAHLPDFIRKERESGAAIVVGNRMRDVGNMPWVRLWTNRTLSWIVSRLSGQAIPDSQCGYRLVTRAFAQRFHPTTRHFDLESEMLVEAGRQGMRVESVEIRTIYAGESSHIHPVRDTLLFIRFLFRQWRRPGPAQPLAR